MNSAMPRGLRELNLEIADAITVQVRELNAETVTGFAAVPPFLDSVKFSKPVSAAGSAGTSAASARDRIAILAFIAGILSFFQLFANVTIL